MRRTVYSHDYNKRPGWINRLNSFLRTFRKAGLEVRLDKDNLIKAARKRTGLQDLGKDFTDEPLDRLMESINKEARLHPVGRFITRQRMINLLCTRLRAEWWFKKHPEILESELYPVMLIIGLQRTGTTKLQRMLAADPDTRSLRSWEAINPAPLNGHIHEKHLRIKEARRSEKALKILSPGFFTIHPVEHLEPEEDILLLDVSFMSTTPEATMHVPEYSAWLENTDQSPAYEYAVKLLKLLQFQRPAKRWILKSPHHLEFLDLTEKYFGKVNYLWTHRDIHYCIPSFLSMMAHGRAIFTDRVDAKEVAGHWVRKNSYMIRKALNFRNKTLAGSNRIMDIRFEDFIKNPLETIQRIYPPDNPITPELWRKLKRMEEVDIREKYGHHVYDLKDFGISEKEVEDQFSEYIHFFNRFNNKNR